MKLRSLLLASSAFISFHATLPLSATESQLEEFSLESIGQHTSSSVAPKNTGEPSKAMQTLSRSSFDLLTTDPRAEKLTASFKTKGAFSDVDIIHKFREELGKLPKNQRTKYLFSPKEELIPLVTGWISFMENYPIKDDQVDFKERIAKVVNEAKEKVEKKDVSIAWYLVNIFRMAASVSNPSDDEKSIFSHVFQPEVYIGLSLEGKNWLEDLASIEDNANIFTANELSSFYKASSDLDYRGTKKVIKSTIDQDLPAQLPLGFPKVGKVSIIEMLFMTLDGLHIHAFPVPTQNTKAHGVTEDNKTTKGLTPLGFIAHDRLHSELYMHTLKTAYYHHIMREAEQIRLQSGDVQEFLEQATPQVFSKRVTLLTNLLKEISLKIALENDQKSLAGLFFMLREYPGWSKEALEKEDAVSALSAMKDHTEKSLKGRSVWESPEDAFQTSPITGQTSLSQDELITAYHAGVNGGTIKPTPYMPYVQRNPDAPNELLPLTQIDFKRSKVAVTPEGRFIDFNIQLKNLSKLSYSVATLKHKWLNISDSIGLLKYAGVTVDVAKELPEDPVEARIQVIKDLTTVQEALNGLLTSFLEKATKLVTEQFDTSETNGMSLDDAYAQQRLTLKEKLEKITVSVVPSVAETDGVAPEGGTEKIIETSDAQTAVFEDARASEDSSSTLKTKAISDIDDRKQTTKSGASTDLEK